MRPIPLGNKGFNNIYNFIVGTVISFIFIYLKARVKPGFPMAEVFRGLPAAHC